MIAPKPADPKKKTTLKLYCERRRQSFMTDFHFSRVLFFIFWWNVKRRKKRGGGGLFQTKCAIRPTSYQHGPVIIHTLIL